MPNVLFLSNRGFSKRTESYNRYFSNGNFDITNVRAYFRDIFSSTQLSETLKLSYLKLSYLRSYLYAAANDVDNAFVYINKTLEEDLSYETLYTYYLLLRSTAMDNLKSDPRYDELITRLKLQEYL